MCTFEMRVILCGCEDPGCKQKESELAGFLKEEGHPIKLNWYYRQGPLCTGYFRNDDPNRLVVRLGMDPKNANSRMDCTNKIIKVEEYPERSTLICGECKKHCSN